MIHRSKSDTGEKMKTTKTVYLAGLFLAMGIYGHAQEGVLETGNDLAKAWHSFNKFRAEDTATATTVLEAGEFIGFIRGAVQMASYNNFFDIPERVTHGQVFSIVGKYIDDHPEKLHFPAISMVVLALNEAFPPKK